VSGPTRSPPRRRQAECARPDEKIASARLYAGRSTRVGRLVVGSTAKIQLGCFRDACSSPVPV
jgi:hypothetical protein